MENKKQISIDQVISNEDLPNLHRFKHGDNEDREIQMKCVYTIV